AIPDTALLDIALMPLVTIALIEVIPDWNATVIRVTAWLVIDAIIFDDEPKRLNALIKPSILTADCVENEFIAVVNWLNVFINPCKPATPVLAGKAFNCVIM